ncbi:hypothetical protein Tco_0842329 [Tanacetum coccineum]|uniref:Xylulose kinase-1 n=1 Tax=Tanacetum coccineum TaxID=301880 RepID=A0ABQ5B1N7_9ASTR
MANLEFCDKHNMVAYLKKPTGSEVFQEIVDFLNDSYIRYALTKNPSIYVSLIEKFWQTATVRTVDNEEQEITATVDGKEFTITEASVRRHLQLADVDGISVLPTTEIFDQLSLMGYVLIDDKLTFQKGMLVIQAKEGKGLGHPSEPQLPPSTAQPINEEPILNVVSSSHQKTQTPRQALNQVTELHQTSEPIPNVSDEAVYEELDDRVERAITTAASLDAEQASGDINRTQFTAMPNVPLPQGISIGGSPRCQEAMGVPLLRLESGELGGKLEANKEARRIKIVVSDDEEDLEDSSKQGRMIKEIDQDAGVTLVTPTHSQEDQPKDQLGVFSATKVLADAANENVHTYTRRRRVVNTGSGGISTASRLSSTAEELVSTAGASMPVSIAGIVQEVNISIPLPVVIKDKGKGKMEEEQDRLGHEAVVRLQKELDEEERQRMARVHKATQSFTEEEWENIRARVEADEELSRRLQAEERNKYSEVDQAKMLQLKRYSFDELKELFETTMKNVNTFVPMETEVRGRVSELVAGSSQATIIDSVEVGSSKRDAEAELYHEGSKRQKTNEASGSVQEQPEE